MFAHGFSLALLLALAATGLACNKGAQDPRGPDQAAPQAAAQPAPPRASPVGPPPEQLATKLPTPEIRASLPPLPVASFPLPRPADEVQMAYEFAGLHPEVLKYVPCYCGCEQSGHQHNESCFVASRDADGRVVSWDTHGMG
jgi:hypothetical protein